MAVAQTFLQCHRRHRIRGRMRLRLETTPIPGALAEASDSIGSSSVIRAQLRSPCPFQALTTLQGLP
jgi:hypothetical protein